MRPTESPDVPTERLATARREVRTALVRFVRALRASGAAVPVNAAVPAAEALTTVGLEDREAVREAVRAAVLSRREDFPVYDRLFPRFWDSLGAALRGETGGPSGLDSDATPDGRLAPQTVPAEQSGSTVPDDASDRDDTEGGGEMSVAPDDGGRSDGDQFETAAERTAARFSPFGSSAPFTGGQLSDATDEELRDAVSELTAALASLAGRRTVPAAVGRPDLRTAMRRSHGTGGAVFDLPRHADTPTAVRGLVLVDVSKSVLDTVDRGFLLQFMRAVAGAWRTVRQFFFDTDVTEVTAALDQPTPAAAVSALEAAEASWGGGTRIGEAFTTVRDRYPTAVDRRTVVLVVSDGLETGDVSDLESGATWLSRQARQVFWLNPLAASPSYEPVCRGMAAALPYLDGLFAFAGVRDIREITRQLRQHGPARPVGYEHDWRDRRHASET